MKFSKENIILLILAGIQFTHVLDFMIMMPLGPKLIRLFEITPKEFSMLVSAYTFSAGIFGFIGAFFVDKYDRKKVLMLGYTGFVVGTFLCAFAGSFELLLAARIFTGMFGGLIGSQILSIIGDIIPNERRASAMGKVMASFSVASIVGVPFGLTLADWFSWQTPFITLGCMGVFIIAAIFFGIPPINAHLQNVSDDDKKKFAVITNIINDKNQLLALSLMIALMFGQFTIIPFLSPSMVSNVGFREDQLKYIYLVGGILTIFSSPLIGKWADKKGRYPVFATFILISLIPLFLITNMPKVEIYVALTVTAVFFITMSGRMIPSQAMTTSAVIPQHRGGFMSVSSSLQQLAAGAASYLAGLIVVKSETTGQLLHYEYVGYFAICMSVVALIIAKYVKAVG